MNGTCGYRFLKIFYIAKKLDFIYYSRVRDEIQGTGYQLKQTIKTGLFLPPR